jgi:hypothetical protein
MMMQYMAYKKRVRNEEEKNVLMHSHEDIQSLIQPVTQQQNPSKKTETKKKSTMTKSQIPLLIPYLLIVSALFHVPELTFPISFARMLNRAVLLLVHLFFLLSIHNSSQNKKKLWT